MSGEYRVSIWLALAAFVGGFPLAAAPTVIELDPFVANVFFYGGIALFLLLTFLAVLSARSASKVPNNNNAPIVRPQIPSKPLATPKIITSYDLEKSNAS